MILLVFYSFYNFLELNYIRYYITETTKIIDPILDEYSVKYLNEQVKKEKKEFNKCINNKNKCNKNDFKKIITQFLSYNFYYISQKYIIYRVIADVSESICETIENYINIIINDFLKQNKPDYLEEIFYQKFEDFEQKINKYRINSNIYYENNENNININTNVSQIISNGELVNIRRVISRRSEYPAPSPI